METVQFTGTEDKIENLHLALGISDNDMPQQSETRVYVLDTEEFETRITDEEFMELAECCGRVYTLEGFTQAFNQQDLNTEVDVIRFINTPKFD